MAVAARRKPSVLCSRMGQDPRWTRLALAMGLVMPAACGSSEEPAPVPGVDGGVSDAADGPNGACGEHPTGCAPTARCDTTSAPARCVCLEGYAGDGCSDC